MPIFPEDDDSIHSYTNPSYASERFHRQIEELLFIMGRPELDIDDESQFMDFLEPSSGEWTEFQDAVKKTYGVDVDSEDCFWEAAEKLRENGF